jgi:serine/threonine-protein kinase HipA
VINRELGFDLEDVLPDMRYMLEPGSDRVGALDFQASPTEYLTRGGDADLQAIADGALAVEDPERSDHGLASAVRHALTAAGGSQPKAFVTVDGRQWLAKFQTSYDAAARSSTPSGRHFMSPLGRASPCPSRAS